MKRDMMDTGTVTAIGVFNNTAEAWRAVEALEAADYRDAQIRVIEPQVDDIDRPELLRGFGIREEDVKQCASELEAGHALVTVRAMNSQHAQGILDRCGSLTREQQETFIPGNALPSTPY
jgi:hypothetical protein